MQGLSLLDEKWAVKMLPEFPDVISEITFLPSLGFGGVFVFKGDLTFHEGFGVFLIMHMSKCLRYNCGMACTLSAQVFCKSYYVPLQGLFAYPVECRAAEGRFSLVPNIYVLETTL